MQQRYRIDVFLFIVTGSAQPPSVAATNCTAEYLLAYLPETAPAASSAMSDTGSHSSRDGERDPPSGASASAAIQSISSVMEGSTVVTTPFLIPILKRNERLRELHERHIRMIGEEDSWKKANPLWIEAMETSIDIFGADVRDEDLPKTTAVSKTSIPFGSRAQYVPKVRKRPSYIGVGAKNSPGSPRRTVSQLSADRANK
eukprot:6175742-Pleurochrysis_carterae.AAC.6